MLNHFGVKLEMLTARKMFTNWPARLFSGAMSDDYSC